MNVSKVVSGSLAGAALSWSAGANADQIQAWLDGKEAAMEFTIEEVDFWCFAVEGTEAYAPCVQTHAYYAGLDLTTYGGSGFGNWDPTERDYNETPYQVHWMQTVYAQDFVDGAFSIGQYLIGFGCEGS